MDFEQVLLQQVYTKNVELKNLEIKLSEYVELNADLENRLQAQEQVNQEQKNKIEKMIEKSKKVESEGDILHDVANMIKGSNLKEGCKEIVLNVFDIYKSNKKREKEISLHEELSNQLKKEKEQMNNGN